MLEWHGMIESGPKYGAHLMSCPQISLWQTKNNNGEHFSTFSHFDASTDTFFFFSLQEWNRLVDEESQQKVYLKEVKLRKYELRK